MAKVERFEDLTCWQEARALTNGVYRLARDGALAKDFRLRGQLTGAAVSVMSSIAEGFARFHRKEFIRFSDIAQSSAVEAKSLLYVVLDQSYAAPEAVEKLQQQSEKTKALTLGLLRYVHQSISGDAPNNAAHEPPALYRGSTPDTLHLPERFVTRTSIEEI